MPWAVIWAILQDKNYPDEFKRWVEKQYKIDSLTDADIPELVNVINEDYAATQPDPRAPDIYSDAQGGMWYDKKDPVTGAVTPTRYTPPDATKGNDTLVSIRQENGYNIGTYKAPDGSMYDAPLSEAADPLAAQKFAYSQEQDRIAAQRQAAIDAENQKMNLWNIQRDLLGDAQNRQKMEWEAIQTRQSAQAAQDLRDAAALNEAEARWSQPDAPKFASNAPVDWISVWKANQQPNQAAARQNAYSFYKDQVTPDQMNLITQRSGTDLNRLTNIWDNAAQAYRPETDFEYEYRTKVQPLRQTAMGQGPVSAQQMGLTEYSPAQANIQWATKQYDAQNPIDPYNFEAGNAARSQFLEGFTNAQREYRPVGPQRPGFLAGVVGTQGGSTARLENVGGVGNYNPWKNQINLNTLGRTGNAVAPVSAQMYQGWTPSQQAMYGGLVNTAMKYPGKVDDFEANVKNMWTASKTGSKATRRW